MDDGNPPLNLEEVLRAIEDCHRAVKKAEEAHTQFRTGPYLERIKELNAVSKLLRTYANETIEEARQKCRVIMTDAVQKKREDNETWRRMKEIIKKGIDNQADDFKEGIDQAKSMLKLFEDQKRSFEEADRDSKRQRTSKRAA